MKEKAIRKMNKVNKINIQKEPKGITLVALVVTIIILLILAGVTISTLTGDNSLIKKRVMQQYCLNTRDTWRV